MSKKDSKTKELKEKLFYKKKNIYKLVNDDVVSKAYDFCDGYKAFLTVQKLKEKQ